MEITPARRHCRTWEYDSRQWEKVNLRPSDIIIATYPKSGTTWTQRIVGMLVFQSPAPIDLMKVSPWPDRRFGLSLNETIAQLAAQDHRRFIKSHLPIEALPWAAEISYIHVARDGRDVAMSWHNHHTGYRPEVFEERDRIGNSDPEIARAYPRPFDDPADEFHRWLTQGVLAGDEDGCPHPSYFRFEQSWWRERHRPNVFSIHYNDLKQDLASSIYRIADFLEIVVSPDLLRKFEEAASIDAMRRDGAQLLPRSVQTFDRGPDRFLNKGTNKRWEGTFRDEDLALYRQRLDRLHPALAHWLQHGGPIRELTSART